MARQCLLFVYLLLSSSITAFAQQPDKEKTTLLLQNQQYEDVIAYLIPFYQKTPGDIWILNELGYANYQNDDKEKSLFYYQQLLHLDSSHIAANQYTANILISYKRYDSAKQPLLRLIRIFPDKPGYYRMLGNVYKWNAEPDPAFSYFRQAYLMAPMDKRNAAAYAESLIYDSNYRKADSILYAGLKNDSFNTSLLKLLVESAYRSKNYEGLINPAERLLEREDISISILTKLVFTYFTLKKYTDCIRICDYMDSNQLAGETIYYYEAKSWAKQDNMAKSNELFRKCLNYSISKTSELYYFSLAQNHEGQNSYRLAIADYDTAYYLFKNPDMLLQAGRIWDEHLHNPKKAKQYYLRYLQLANPQSPADKTYYLYIKKRAAIL